MRTGQAARGNSTPSSYESDSGSNGDSNLSTQAQVGSRLEPADQRFAALNRAPSVQEAVNQYGYKRTLSGLDELRDDAKDTKLADKALVAKAAIKRLRSVDLDPKLGGSLAARLRGADKRPDDVDIEMPSSTQLNAGFKHLQGRFSYAGQLLRIRAAEGGFIKGESALLDVTLEESDSRSSSAYVGIDLINENLPQFNRGLVAPQRTGSPSVGTTSPFRLIVDKIDRRRKKPDISKAKHDAKTVYELLESMGYQPSDPSHWQAIREGIEPKLKGGRDTVDAYMEELHDMLVEYADSLNRRDAKSKGKGKGKADCSVM